MSRLNRQNRHSWQHLLPTMLPNSTTGNRADPWAAARFELANATIHLRLIGPAGERVTESREEIK
jgi:hypothetical protein